MADRRALTGVTGGADGSAACALCTAWKKGDREGGGILLSRQSRVRRQSVTGRQLSPRVSLVAGQLLAAAAGGEVESPYRLVRYPMQLLAKPSSGSQLCHDLNRGRQSASRWGRKLRWGRLAWPGRAGPKSRDSRSEPAEAQLPQGRGGVRASCLKNHLSPRRRQPGSPAPTLHLDIAKGHY